MQQYVAIIDRRSFYISVLCIVVTWICLRLNISYDIDLIIFSIALIFPLVFTIREAFRRRQLAIRQLGALKAAISAFYWSLENSKKLSDEEKQQVQQMMNDLSASFIERLQNGGELDQVRNQVRDVYHFVDTRRDSISDRASIKLVRLVQDIQEAIEVLHGIKTHGTPVSLRAYCLVFIYSVPFIFSPNLVYSLANLPVWMTYTLSVLHGFILMSLYNLQEHIEDPFDQIGLDDIHLEEFRFLETELPQLEQPAPVARP